MIDEAQRCLDERVVENADLVDGGVIFGTGFAPFRGGPLHYKAAQGRGEPERAAAE
jgi:3-hydroxyacyl-CoA dehydrogenase / enoyl-CoA hydratase / 3-hydroxybutyryl-CoA epimerase